MHNAVNASPNSTAALTKPRSLIPGIIIGVGFDRPAD